MTPHVMLARAAEPTSSGTHKKGFRLGKSDSWTKENDDAFDDMFQTHSPMVGPLFHA